MLISVIVPVYNSERTLAKCLDSLLSYDTSFIEIIIVNDGSTDQSDEICKEYLKCSNNIKYIKKANSGVSDSRNIGILNSTGDYIYFLDSDDYLQADAMSKIKKIIEVHNNPELVTLAHNIIYSRNDRVEFSPFPYKEDIIMTSMEDYLTKMFSKNGSYWACWKMVIKKSVLINNHILFDTKLKCSEDCDLFFEISKKVDDILVYNLPVVNYLTDSYGSITNTMSYNQILSRILVYKKHFNFYRENNQAMSFFANKLANAFYDCYIISDKEEISNIQHEYDDSKKYLAYTYGKKFVISKKIWSLFGISKGSRILHFINRIRKGSLDE